MLKNKLLAATGNSEEPLYSDSVFSAFTYTGNGATQTITNGIDLAGKGGMVWVKSRNFTFSNHIMDTVRGVGVNLQTDTTAAQATNVNSLTSVSSNGFTLNSGNSVNGAYNYIAWTFRKSPKFFDVVTYTGTGVAGRTVAHSLGVAPGMMIVKCTSAVGAWGVYHRSNTANPETDVLYLNNTSATADNDTYWNDTLPTASVFTVGANIDVNANGATYVAYIFAHDSSTDGIVQCGSFTTDASGNATVNLGWEPQYVMVKASAIAQNWYVLDSSRGFTVGGGAYLVPNTAGAEVTPLLIQPTATGFKNNAALSLSETYIYLAIRRPNKPPTVGTQVYSAIARTGTGAAATVTGVGFAPDLVALHSRSGTTGGRWEDRLRGATIELVPETTAAETTVAQSITSFGMDGFALGTDGDWNTNTATYIHHCFKRAPGVMDQVCYTGTGVAKTEAHNLGVVPELMIVRGRGALSNWYVYCAYNPATALDRSLFIQTNDQASSGYISLWNSVAPTSSTITVNSAVNNTSATYVAYLFATKAGISKVGSYTGNATTNAINCGFTTGARFVLIKRTDSTGDWYVWDTVRGIIAGNDPYLLLNSTAAEVTSTDYIDPVSTGFEISSTAPAAINASGGTFIYLAFA